MRIAKHSVTVDQSKYRFHMGHAPKGRGMWAFGPQNARISQSLEQAFWVSGEYAEAKEEAIEHFAALGIQRIEVLP